MKKAKSVIKDESRALLKIAKQFCPSGRTTADKRLRYASPKLPLALRIPTKRYMSFRLGRYKKMSSRLIEIFEDAKLVSTSPHFIVMLK